MKRDVLNFPLMKKQRSILSKLQYLDHISQKMIEDLKDTKMENENFVFPLNIIEKFFHIEYPKGIILNVYLVGSKYFESDWSSSDLDFVLIADNIEKKNESDLAITKQIDEPFYKGKLDICVYENENFKYLLERHELWALALLYHNQEGILQQKIKYEFQPRICAMKYKCFEGKSIILNKKKLICTFLV